MDKIKLNTLKQLLATRLDKLENEKDKEEILLTKAVLEFILYLVNEELHKFDMNLVASQKDIDNLLNTFYESQ